MHGSFVPFTVKIESFASNYICPALTTAAARSAELDWSPVTVPTTTSLSGSTSSVGACGGDCDGDGVLTSLHWLDVDGKTSASPACWLLSLRAARIRSTISDGSQMAARSQTVLGQYLRAVRSHLAHSAHDISQRCGTAPGGIG